MMSEAVSVIRQGLGRSTCTMNREAAVNPPHPRASLTERSCIQVPTSKEAPAIIERASDVGNRLPESNR
jgi:hypothetical protein